MLNPFDTLAHQHTALLAGTLDSYLTHVMLPLAPFWKPLMAYHTGTEDPALAAAHMMNLYLPEHGTQDGLQALKRFRRDNTWQACQRAAQTALNALEPHRHGITLDRINLSLALMTPRGTQRLEHYTGWGGIPGNVMVLAWPTDTNLPKLPAATAHEINHNIRFAVEPMDPITVPLGQYLVAEGVAQAFEAELFGEEALGPWATALNAADSEPLKERYAAALELRGFKEVQGYIFGDWAAPQFGYEPVSVPDFAGYTLGYALVRSFTQRKRCSAADATYMPWQEIVQESGFFGV